MSIPENGIQRKISVILSEKSVDFVEKHSQTDFDKYLPNAQEHYSMKLSSATQTEPEVSVPPPVNYTSRLYVDSLMHRVDVPPEGTEIILIITKIMPSLYGNLTQTSENLFTALEIKVEDSEGLGPQCLTLQNQKTSDDKELCKEPASQNCSSENNRQRNHYQTSGSHYTALDIKIEDSDIVVVRKT